MSLEFTLEGLISHCGALYAFQSGINGRFLRERLEVVITCTHVQGRREIYRGLRLASNSAQSKLHGAIARLPEFERERER